MAEPTVLFTDRRHGDLAIESPGVAARREAIHPGPWTWLQQVHGADVVVVTDPGAHAGVAADAAVTVTPGAVLAVQVADCAPVALIGDGAVGVVHAGWRGLVAGVVPAAVAALQAIGAGRLRAVVGPCIHGECYSFGATDLDGVSAVLGAGVRGTTADGDPSLDLPAAVRSALSAAGVDDIDVDDTCTACSSRLWSYRARRDVERQAVVAWLPS